MKRISNKILASLLMTLPLMWQGCAEEDFQVNPVDGEAQGITLTIPYVSPDAEMSEGTRAALTRAGQTMDYDAQEAVIKKLYVFAYPEVVGDHTNGVKKAYEFEADEIAKWDKTTSATVSKTLDLEVGKYRIYVVANVDIPNYATIEETGDNGLRHMQFATTTGPLSAFEDKGLPMSCKAEEISVTAGDSKDGSHYVTVKSNETTKLAAEMKFAVSKVRVSFVKSVEGNFDVNSLKFKQLADKNHVFTGYVDPTQTAGEYEAKDLGRYYDLTTPADNKYPVENLSNGATTSDGKDKWIWQAYIYVPERLTKNTTSMTMNVGSEKAFVLGEKAENGDRMVKRSQYYRYYITPNNCDATLEVMGWDPQTIAVSLNGPVTLDVDKTELGEISGTESKTMHYSSNTTVSFVSPKKDNKDVFLFESTACTDGSGYDYNLEVKVNPELGIQSEEAMKGLDYFYAVAGPIRKKISATPNLKAFLIVTPKKYTVVMKEIANVETYSVEFTYSTNLDKLVYTKDTNGDFTGNDLSYYVRKAGASTGTYVRPGTGYELGQNGTVTVIFSEPYNQQKYQNQSNIKYHWTASQTGQESLSDDTELEIIPNRNGYRLWFRDVSDSWDNVHVYVYQPLQWNNNGSWENIMCYRAKYTINNVDYYSNENALQFSFTGKKQFKGWSLNNISPGWSNDWGAWAYGDLRIYNKGTDGAAKAEDRDNYYYQTDFLEKWRSEISCGTCKSSTDYARIWPGIQMKKMQGGNQDKWWYIDLPAMCQPGKALIMFTRGHGGVGEQDKNYRYPLHMVPGIPLYDYPDREGWMKYDPSKGNQNEFVDDQPDFGNVVNPPTPTNLDLYVIKFQTDWNRKYVHVYSKNDQSDFGSNWKGDNEKSVDYDYWNYYVINNTDKKASQFGVIFYEKDKVTDTEYRTEITINASQFKLQNKPGVSMYGFPAAEAYNNYGGQVYVYEVSKSTIDK